MTLRSRWSPRLTVLLLALTGALVLAGCGGGDSDDGERDEFVTEVNRMCSDLESSLEGFDEDVSTAASGGDMGEVADLLESTQADIEDSVDEIEAVTPPEDDKEKMGEWVDITRQQVDLIGDMADTFRNTDITDPDSAAELQQQSEDFNQELDDLSSESNEIAEDLGLDDCVDSDDDSGSSSVGDQEDFVTGGNELCANLFAKVEEVKAHTETLSTTDVDARADAVEELADEVDNVADEMEALDPPEGDEQKVEDLADSYREAAELYRGFADSIRATDPYDSDSKAALDEENQRFQEENDALAEESNALAQDLGLDGCSG